MSKFKICGVLDILILLIQIPILINASEFRGYGLRTIRNKHEIEVQAFQYYYLYNIFCLNQGKGGFVKKTYNAPSNYCRGESHVGEFVEGLGPGQLVGRQVLGMPCLGEIQLSFFDRKGHLEVEVIRARGLQQKNTSKPLPTPYVKLHLLDGKTSVEKMRTSAPARRTLDPLFQQQFTFSTNYKEKILQVKCSAAFLNLPNIHRLS